MRSNIEWRYWGKRDPLWAVMTAPGRELDGSNPWTPSEFLALGEQDFADTVRHWDHYGRNPAGVCIEIGCGSGRMTRQLARAFDRVFAIDVSEEQVDTAKRLLGPDVERVDFSIVDEPAVKLRPSTCVAMFSSHVFQHLATFSGIEAYLRETFHALKPGGTACFHLPVPGGDARDRSAFREIVQRTRSEIKRRLGKTAIMEYHQYRVSRISRTLRDIGFTDVELRVFTMTASGLPQSHFFVRKPER